VVSNMVVADVVEEESAHPAKQRTIDSCGCAAKERPFTLPVVGDGGVGVVEVSEHDDPVVDEEVRNHVIFEEEVGAHIDEE